MTNLEHLINSLKRAEEESMTLYKNSGVGNSNYSVIHDGKVYQVTVENDEVIKCDCPNCTYRKVICKHMVVVAKTMEINIKQLSVITDDVIE